MKLSAEAYFTLSRPVLTDLKVVLIEVPTWPTTVMMATPMRAAIRPYSIAVAPDSHLTKRAKTFFMTDTPTG